MGASQLKTGEGTLWCGHAHAAMVQYLFKLCLRFFPLACLEINQTTNIIRRSTRPPAKLVRRCSLQHFNSSARVAPARLYLRSDARQPDIVDEGVSRKALAQLICRGNRLTDVARHGLRESCGLQRSPASGHGQS